MHRHHRARCAITACTVLVLIALGLPVAPVRAGTIFPLTSCDEGSFRTAVSRALAAGAGNTVLFECVGEISLTTGGGGTITISKDLTIDGNDGNGNVPTIYAPQITPFAVATATRFAIDGLLIKGGGLAVSGNDGGILNNGGTVTVTNSSFEALAAARGGGIYNDSGTVTVTNSSFISNRATSGGGGGLYNYQGTLRVTNSTFSGNSASDGGGIVNNNGTLIVTNSTFTGNTATGASACTGGGPSGGGICSVFSTLGNHYTALTNTLVANSTGGDLGGSGFLGNNNLVDDAAIGTGFTDGTSGNIVGHPAPVGRLCRCWNVTQAAPLLPGSSAIDAGAAVGSNSGSPPSQTTAPSPPQTSAASRASAPPTSAPSSRRDSR